MLLRKFGILGMVLLFNSVVVPITYADMSIADAVQTMISYFSSATTIKNQADATLMFMVPPGNSDTAKSVGTAAGIVESTLNDILIPKEVNDFNWGLYATGMSGDPYGTFITNHKALYCAPSSGIENSLAGDVCQSNDLVNQYGDIKMSSLLAPSMYTTTEQQTMAQRVIQTLTIPFPNSDLADLITNGLAKSSDKQKFAKTMTALAAINVATNSFNEIYGSRVFTMTKDSTPQPVSIMSIMENESGRRFKSSAWYDAVQQSSNEALLRELVHMESYRLWMDYYRYRQNERVEALLAVMTAQITGQTLQLSTASMQMQ